jgi:hypothetical protein
MNTYSSYRRRRSSSALCFYCGGNLSLIVALDDVDCGTTDGRVVATFGSGINKGDASMKILASTIAAVCLLTSVPSIAGAEDSEVCVGPACVRHHDRDHWRHHEGFARERGCREVTIHEDGVTKHIRKCERFWR